MCVWPAQLCDDWCIDLPRRESSRKDEALLFGNKLFKGGVGREGRVDETDFERCDFCAGAGSGGGP